MLRTVKVKDVHGEPRIGFFEAQPSKQQLENFIAPGTISRREAILDSEILSQAIALAVDYKSLDKYCRENGIV